MTAADTTAADTLTLTLSTEEVRVLAAAVRGDHTSFAPPDHDVAADVLELLDAHIAQGGEAAAVAVAEWLAGIVDHGPVRRSSDPDWKDGSGPVVHAPAMTRVYISDASCWSVAYEGGPEDWTWKEVEDAQVTGDLALPDGWWVEAATSWAVTLHRNE